MAANLLRHERFDRVPRQPQKRRRGPLPRGVANIRHVARLKAGVLAEIVGSRKPENNGRRVIIKGYDAESSYCWLVKSLSDPLRCSDGALDAEAYLKDGQLRRVWIGLTANERIQLRMRRAS